MDYRQAVSYPFQDGKLWKTILIAFLCNITLIGQPLTVGYALRTSRRFLRGQPLPDWNDWGGLYLDGLRVIALVCGYLFPGLLLISLSVVVTVMYWMVGHNPRVLEQLNMTLAVNTFIGIILSIPAAVVLAAAYMQILREGTRLSECFNFKSTASVLRGNMWAVIKCVLAAAAVHMFFNTLGLGLGVVFSPFIEETIANYIGLSLFHPFAVLITAVLFAQLAKKLLPRIID